MRGLFFRVSNVILLLFWASFIYPSQGLAKGSAVSRLSRLADPSYTGAMTQAQVWVLPGWQDSGFDHWQSRWERLHGFKRVAQHDWMRPLRGDWITQLENTLLSKRELVTQIPYGLAAQKPLNPEPTVVLVAHSLGCHLVSSWAAVSQQTHRVRGALLVAPPDCTREDFPPELHSWRQPVLQRLPFPSVCVVSSDDPFDPDQQGAELAARWGSTLVQLGPRGHINADSGLGDWPEGLAMLRQWQPLPV
jgi:uncharacterized protein